MASSVSVFLKFRLGGEEKELVARHANDTGHASVAEYLRALVSADLVANGHPPLTERTVGAPHGNENRHGWRKARAD